MERAFVLGPEKVRATILTTGAETDGRHDLIDSVLPARPPISPPQRPRSTPSGSCR
jgi:hypothetical protein